MKRWLPGLLLLMMVAVGACKKDEDRAPLVAAIEGEQFEILAGNSIDFKDVSQGQASHWKWTFEGGTPETSELSSPTVKYDKAGKYKVTLVVSNASQSSTITKEQFVTVGYNTINVNFTADKTVVMQDEAVTFTDQTTGIPETWSWEFIHETNGKLYSSTQKNPVISFVVAGKYSVKLTATNPGSTGTKTVEKMIEVIDKTFVSADLKVSTTATYTGANVVFEDISLGNVETRTWTFEGGNPATSSEARPTVAYAAPGRYKVKLTVSNPYLSSDKEIDKFILVVPGDQLLAFLPFNGGAVDAGPLAIPTTIVGTPAFAQDDRLNGTGNAVTFDGASGVMLESATLLNLGTGDYSVSAWIKTSSTARMMVWQESGKNGSGDNQSWVRINDNATTQFLRFNTEQPGGSSILSIGTPGKVNDGTWKHIVAVRRGVEMLVYINGVKAGELASKPATPRNVTGNQPFKIGLQQGASSNSNFFNGQIDDLMIYRKALTEAEITALYGL
ncbi:LamG-like jellyroll fold domain-containing protein [Paraflavitalea pollutisoli]|uniref:LamG-like jellyroll fold domain-containing protein n=1 Tax=Paraflavitalea pollutisoli TaxID=3034143 RepID=UPI0023ED0635|nr:PKD domain-containing protein [Paraflavitalea sp. H1-2-19X]